MLISLSLARGHGPSRYKLGHGRISDNISGITPVEHSSEYSDDEALQWICSVLSSAQDHHNDITGDAALHQDRAMPASSAAIERGVSCPLSPVTLALLCGTQVNAADATADALLQPGEEEVRTTVYMHL